VLPGSTVKRRITLGVMMLIDKVTMDELPLRAVQSTGSDPQTSC